MVSAGSRERPGPRERSGPPLAVFTDPGEVDPRPGVEELEHAGFEVAVLDTADPSEIAERALAAAALIVGYARVDAGLLDHLPDLRIVATMSVGVDAVDLASAAARRVWVTNVPDAASEEVAVHALAMALGLIRRVSFLDRHVRQGGWALDATEEMRRPSTLTLGVIGLGRIGSRFAELGSPVFGRVLGHDPYLDKTRWPAAVARCELDGLLSGSDVVSLHMPGQPGSAPLLDERRLALLPLGAAVVNVSRGGLLDTAALLAALDAGRLSGAALDVLDEEPPPTDAPVRSHPRVVLTPHLAYLSAESARDYPLKAAQNVVAWATTGEPLDVIVEGERQRSDLS